MEVPIKHMNAVHNGAGQSPRAHAVVR